MNKKLIALIFIFHFTLFAFILIGCNSTNKTEVKTTPEMEEFMKAMDGKYESVTAAITKFASKPDLNTADMDTKDLRDPEIISASVNGTSTCYTLKSNDGAKDCEYELCWENGKIISITDKSTQ